MEEELRQSSYAEQKLDTLNNDQYVQTIILDLIKKSKDRSNSLVWQMDVQISVGQMLQNLSGIIVREENGEMKIYKSENPPMNSRGVVKVANLLNPLMNKDIISSNLSMKEIAMFMQNFIEFEIELFIYYEDYGLEAAKVVVLKNSINQAVYATLKRAFEDGTRNWNAKMINVSENVQKNDTQRSRNILDEITNTRR